jgi:hypothetical protein
MIAQLAAKLARITWPVTFASQNISHLAMVLVFGRVAFHRFRLASMISLQLKRVE